MNQDQQIRDLEAELAKVNKVCAVCEGKIRALEDIAEARWRRILELEAKNAELQAILDGLAEEGDF